MIVAGILNADPIIDNDEGESRPWQTDQNPLKSFFIHNSSNLSSISGYDFYSALIDSILMIVCKLYHSMFSPFLACLNRY